MLDTYNYESVSIPVLWFCGVNLNFPASIRIMILAKKEEALMSNPEALPDLNFCLSP